MTQIDGVLLDAHSTLAFTQALTPVALAASIGNQEQSFTIVGQPALKTTDLVEVALVGAAPAVNVGVASARVTGPATVAVAFANLTAAANVPTAGTYAFKITRP